MLVAAVFSPTGGSRALLNLGALGLLHPVVGPRVLSELDEALLRKAAQLRPRAASLLAVGRVETAPPARSDLLERVHAAVRYAPDAHVAAEALGAEVELMASLDRRHLVGNPAFASIGLRVETPGDVLSWFREQATGRGVSA